MIALGSGVAASMAKTCMLDMTHQTPSRARRSLERKLVNGEIDGESYRTRIEAIEYIEDMWVRGARTHLAATPLDDWHDLGNGCHMRKTHTTSQN